MEKKWGKITKMEKTNVGKLIKMEKKKMLEKSQKWKKCGKNDQKWKRKNVGKMI